MKRRTVLKFAGAVALGAPLGSSQAQTYPSRQIRFIVPYAPGGGADIACRIIAQKMSESMGQPVLVENRPGASEIIGNEALAHAAPDGYTVGFISNALTVNAILQPKLPFDPERDIVPVTRLLTIPLIMVVPPSMPVNSVKELVALAKSEPGKLNYASFGVAGPHALAMEWFKRVSGTDIVAITYKGVAPGLAALVAGEIQVMLTGLSGGMPHIKSGKIRAIATTAAKGVAALPQLAPIARDYPEYDVNTWYGLGVPAGTPAPIVNRIHDETVRALNAPDVRQRFDSLGVEIAPLSQEAFIAMLREESRLWARVIKDARITLKSE